MIYYQNNIERPGNEKKEADTVSTAELKLWASVLELAIHDYTIGKVRNIQSSEFLSAKKWIYTKHQTAKNSFDNICFLCKLIPDNVREKINSDPLRILRRLSNKKYDEEGV
jgi:hypothetical protein